MAVATWVGYPRWYSVGRNRPPQFVVVHYTAGSEGPASAENGAAYDKTRPDKVSTHVFADANSVVRELPDGDRAYAAFYHGNEIGLHLEICGTAQTRAQWLDEVSTATLQMAAKQAAEWCQQHDLEPRRLSVAETRAAWYNPASQRPGGIVGHVDITHAFPEDGGDHTDPGPEFPWDVFLGLVQREIGGTTQPPTEEEDDDMKGLIVQDANSIVRVFDHPVLGTPVYVNIGSGHAVDQWKALGWQFYMCKPGETIGAFGQDLGKVNAEYFAALAAGGGGSPVAVEVTPGKLRAVTTIEPVGE